jgi:hypothetical protein
MITCAFDYEAGNYVVHDTASGAVRELHGRDSESAAQALADAWRTFDLAARFALELSHCMTPEQLDEAVAYNAENPDADTCATHDFCDAGQAMIDAFTAWAGREPDLSDDADIARWDGAWNLAAECAFSVRKIAARQVQA